MRHFPSLHGVEHTLWLLMGLCLFVAICLHLASTAPKALLGLGLWFGAGYLLEWMKS